jgi:hypothetical protein
MSDSRAVEIALENPDALVLGLDLVSHSVKSFPPNCQFRIHDLNLGLSKYYNMFDVVRMRSVAGGVSSPSFLIGSAPFLCAHHIETLILLLPYSCVPSQTRYKKQSSVFDLVGSSCSLKETVNSIEKT